jgi:xanthine/uracil/vitamin C permease (AzgA family)
VNRLDRFFDISARQSTIAAEIRGGVVTFIAMAYIIVLNPIILSSADVAGHKLEFTQVSAMTSLAAGIMTILFGIIARLPFAFAAGLGINSFLATTVVGSLTWPEAMGLVVIDGLIIVLLAVTGLRRMVFDAVPMQLKLSITAGIGLFILFIGLVDAGFVGSTGQPSPPVGLGSFGRIGVLAAVMLVFTLVFANFFDAMGSFTGLAREAGLADSQGTFPRLRSALIVEGAGAVVGGATSSSSNTVFIESGAGIEEGAHTGLANLVTGVLFLAAMFVSPLASIVPTEVAAAALVIVGVMMMSQLRHVDISEFSVALPVVLTVATMPFSYSIANGIGVGFIAWVVLRSAAGKAREISPLLWIVAAGFVLYFARSWIESFIGM